MAYDRLRVGAAALVVVEGALLLAQRGPAAGAFPGTWNLPAGYCQAEEPPPVTAARETAEETGLQITVGDLVDVYYFDDDPRGNGLLLVYEAEVAGGELWRDGREAVAAEFFPPERLPAPLCGGGHDRAIEAWRARILDRWQPGMPWRCCPHCAQRLEERQAFDRLRPVCPACGFIYFRAPKVGVSILVEQEGQLLLVRRAVEPGLGLWSLPSGFVDWDETPELAATREMLEETGLSVADLELVQVRHYSDDLRGPGLNLTYRARVVAGHLQPGDDASVARFFGRDDLPPADAIAFAGHRLMLEMWRRQALP